MSARVNVALAVLVLLLGAAFAVLAVRAPGAAGDAEGGSADERTAAAQDAAARAAATQVQAFLDIDHDDVDAQLDRMLEGATEDFRRQFARQVRTISAEAERRQSSADVTLRQVGLSSWTADAATRAGRGGHRGHEHGRWHQRAAYGPVAHRGRPGPRRRALAHRRPAVRELTWPTRPPSARRSPAPG